MTFTSLGRVGDWIFSAASDSGVMHRRVPLAPKTFDLLLLLVRSPGHAFFKRGADDGTLARYLRRGRQPLVPRSRRCGRHLATAASAWIENRPEARLYSRGTSSRNLGPVQMPAASPTAAVPQPIVPALPAWSQTRGDLPRGFGHRPDDPRWRIPGFRVPAIDRSALQSFNAVAAPLTAYPGSETGPSLSPDGNQVAFSWDGPREDNHDVYVKLVGTGEPVRADEGART